MESLPYAVKFVSLLVLPLLLVACDDSPTDSRTEPELIDFESLPDGSPPVAGMSVTTQFAVLGVVFSYVTFDEQPGTPRICDSTPESPSGVSSDHSVTFDGGTDCGSATLGTITMTFNVATSAVEFLLAFPAGASPDLSASSKSNAALSFTTVSSTAYTAQNGLEMTEVHFRVSGDVDSIDVSQEPGGAVMLIDDVQIRP